MIHIFVFVDIFLGERLSYRACTPHDQLRRSFTRDSLSSVWLHDWCIIINIWHTQPAIGRISERQWAITMHLLPAYIFCTDVVPLGDFKLDIVSYTLTHSVLSIKIRVIGIRNWIRIIFSNCSYFHIRCLMIFTFLYGKYDKHL